MRYLPLASLLVLAALPAAAAAQTTVTLTATDSKSIAEPSNQNWQDNRFRAYYSTSLFYVDGFVKFDMSSIPDSATITGMTLRAYHEANFGSPANGPVITCYRIDDDSWARGQTDNHPGVAEALTGLISTFNSGAQAANDFALNVAAASWTGDLLDDTLSLALRNEALTYSYVYFYGSDVSPAPPELIVTYTSGPSVSVSAGAPGGSMTFDFDNFTPGGAIGVVYGTAGSLTVPSGACAGLTLGLSPLNFPPASGVVFLPANGSGSYQLTRNVGAAGAGLLVQAADVATCTASNVLVL